MNADAAARKARWWSGLSRTTLHCGVRVEEIEDPVHPRACPQATDVSHQRAKGRPMEKILRVDNDMARRRLTSVDAYIAAKPRNVRVVLERVRRAIRKAVPRAEERLSYQMSAYTLDGVHVLCFAGWKAHYALYRVNDALVAAFKSELAPYERSKGSIRFPLSEPVPA